MAIAFDGYWAVSAVLCFCVSAFLGVFGGKGGPENMVLPCGCSHVETARAAVFPDYFPFPFGFIGGCVQLQPSVERWLAP